MTTRSDTGGAFPLLPINLDASAGPLSFLTLTDRTRAEAASRGFLQATRAPPLWREFDSRKDIGVQQLHGSLERPPGRLNMKEALVAHPPPWLIT